MHRHLRDDERTMEHEVHTPEHDAHHVEPWRWNLPAEERTAANPVATRRPTVPTLAYATGHETDEPDDGSA